MTINRSRQQLPATWDILPGPDDKGCLQINGLKVKYIGDRQARVGVTDHLHSPYVLSFNLHRPW